MRSLKGKHSGFHAEEYAGELLQKIVGDLSVNSQSATGIGKYLLIFWDIVATETRQWSAFSYAVMLSINLADDNVPYLALQIHSPGGACRFLEM